MSATAALRSDASFPTVMSVSISPGATELTVTPRRPQFACEPSGEAEQRGLGDRMGGTTENAFLRPVDTEDRGRVHDAPEGVLVRSGAIPLVTK
jgi:hypothetical protein